MGAFKLAMFGAEIDAIVGLFMGIVGVSIGPFIGAVIGELIYRGKLNEESVLLRKNSQTVTLQAQRCISIARV
jgi:uncharacterized protein YqgC (DUF456 family)